LEGSCGNSEKGCSKSRGGARGELEVGNIVKWKGWLGAVQRQRVLSRLPKRISEWACECLKHSLRFRQLDRGEKEDERRRWSAARKNLSGSPLKGTGGRDLVWSCAKYGPKEKAGAWGEDVKREWALLPEKAVSNVERRVGREKGPLVDAKDLENLKRKRQRCFLLEKRPAEEREGSGTCGGGGWKGGRSSWASGPAGG